MREVGNGIGAGRAPKAICYGSSRDNECTRCEGAGLKTDPTCNLALGAAVAGSPGLDRAVIDPAGQTVTTAFVVTAVLALIGTTVAVGLLVLLTRLGLLGIVLLLLRLARLALLVLLTGLLALRVIGLLLHAIVVGVLAHGRLPGTGSPVAPAHHKCR